MVNRSEFQKLARERIADAKSLLAAKRWSAAYYLAGYGVECALKSCVLNHLASSAEVIFEDRRYSEKCWTHNLNQLVDLAGLRLAFVSDSSGDPDLLSNWNLVKDWNEGSRYERQSKADAEQLYDAIADKRHGVLKWVKRYW